METYDKRTVLAAATKAAREIAGERERLLAEWDARDLASRFFLSAFAVQCRPDYYCREQQKIAERLVFKCSNAVEAGVTLTDSEIDAIKDYWE